MALTFNAPAKLNLMLHVTGRRTDGYHTLNTLIAFTDLVDVLQVEHADSYSLHVDGPFATLAPCDETNLVTRAVRAMEQATGRSAQVRIRLDKNIPAGAGLGGGSADAAATMHALNTIWDTRLPLEALQKIGVGLGAELPVCLAAVPQWVTGIGDGLRPVDVPTRHAVVVWPGVVVSTRDVFHAYQGPYSSEMPGPDKDGMGKNDLTEAAIAVQPVIGVALASMPHARMSGSGSSVFAIFDTADAAKETAARLAAAYPSWWVRACAINP